MKRFLPLTLVASVMLLAGCHLADVPEGDVTEAAHGESTHVEGGHEGLTRDLVITHEPDSAQPVSSTASAFPPSTPPSEKESVTKLGYWNGRKVNTEPTAHDEEGHGDASGHDVEPVGH